MMPKKPWRYYSGYIVVAGYLTGWAMIIALLALLVGGK